MTHHDALWKTINKIATIHHKSRSGLARICGLDATAFNPSKYYSVHGQPRWISTETLRKILIHTNTSPIKFAEMFQEFLDEETGQ